MELKNKKGKTTWNLPNFDVFFVKTTSKFSSVFIWTFQALDRFYAHVRPPLEGFACFHMLLYACIGFYMLSYTFISFPTFSYTLLYAFMCLSYTFIRIQTPKMRKNAKRPLHHHHPLKKLKVKTLSMQYTKRTHETCYAIKCFFSRLLSLFGYKPA